MSDQTAVSLPDESEGEWVFACTVSDVPDDFGNKVDLGDGRAIAIYRVEGRYYAIDDRCTHGEASLSEGLVDGRSIECPFHFGTFDIVSGKALTFPCVANIATYPVRVEGERILVDVGRRDLGAAQ